jgi:hypothetical protein
MLCEGCATNRSFGTGSQIPTPAALGGVRRGITTVYVAVFNKLVEAQEREQRLSRQWMARHQLIGMFPAGQRLDARKPIRNVLVLRSDIKAELFRRIIKISDQ